MYVDVYFMSMYTVTVIVLFASYLFFYIILIIESHEYLYSIYFYNCGWMMLRILIFPVDAVLTNKPGSTCIIF